MKPSTFLPPAVFVAFLVACGRSSELPETTPPSTLSLTPSQMETAVVSSPAMTLPEDTPGAESQVVFPTEPPAWLSDAAVNVLAVVIGDATRREDGIYTYALGFVNAETGEEFELTVPAALAMMWPDSSTFGLLSMDGRTIISMDMTDGSVGTTTLEAEGIRILEGTGPYSPPGFRDMMNPLDIVRDDPSGEGPLIFLSPRSSYSADLAFFAGGEYRVEVQQMGSGGELIWASDPDPSYNGISEHTPAWSPVDPARLAFLQCDDEGTDMCWPQRLFIVDVGTGEELASFPGEFMDISWSSDGSRILYQRLEWQVADSFFGAPCVLDLGTGDNQCFDEIPATHFADLWAPARRLLGLRWNRDGDGFYYVYQVAYYTPTDLEVATPGPALFLGGLCHFDLRLREIDCPSMQAPGLQGLWVEGFELSSDEQFAYLETWREGDYGHGILDLGTGNYSQLPDPPLVQSGAYPFDWVGTLWRPSLREPPRGTPTSIPLRPHASRPTERDMREGLSIWESYGLDDELAPVSPGTRRFSVRVSPGLAFTWSYYWCALGPERLAANLESIAVQFKIGSVEVSPDDILQFDATSGEWACHYWATMLSDWEPGSQASLLLTLRLDRSLSDGADSYEAGDYSFEILAYVDD